MVGMATGYALARGEPAFVNLHTAAGLGNAVNAIANARDCRAPLVILVGQQDRRQIAFEPFLTGRALERLAGEYPVWRHVPGRSQDVPGAIARAYHEAKAARVRRCWWCRWATGSSRPTSSRPGRPRRSYARIRWRVSGRASLPACWRARRRRRLSSALRSKRTGMRWSRSPSGCAARSGRSRSPGAWGSRRITRCSPDTSWQRRLMHDALARTTWC